MWIVSARIGYSDGRQSGVGNCWLGVDEVCIVGCMVEIRLRIKAAGVVELEGPYAGCGGKIVSGFERTLLFLYRKKIPKLV